jgi:hypothetical protein
MFKQLGFGVVSWEDAAAYERVGSLEDCQLIGQTTIGQIFETETTYIVVTNIQEGGGCFDAVVIPKCWVWDITRLKEVRDAKPRAKKMAGKDA